MNKRPGIYIPRYSRLAHSEDFSVEIKTSEAGFEIITMTFRKTGRNMNTREIKVLVNGKNICLITMEPVLPFGDGIVKYGFNFSIKVKISKIFACCMRRPATFVST